MDLPPQLDLSPEDAEDLLRTFPASDLLDPSREILELNLANHDGSPQPLPHFPPDLPIFPVHVILSALDSIRQLHHKLGIPDDVSWETLSYLGHAMRSYRAQCGEPGIRLSQWEWLRFFGALYQVGRLTVTPYRLLTHPAAGPLFWYDEDAAAQLGPGFRKGDPALGIHVPGAEPLTPEACDASIGLMRTAFLNMYPGEPLRIATCTSWLLDDQLGEYLPPDSNILAFQRRFRLVPGARDNDDAIGSFISSSPDTTLGRAVATHLSQGRHWRLRTGWLAL